MTAENMGMNHLFPSVLGSRSCTKLTPGRHHGRLASTTSAALLLAQLHQWHACFRFTIPSQELFMILSPECLRTQALARPFQAIQRWATAWHKLRGWPSGGFPASLWSFPTHMPVSPQTSQDPN